MCARTCSGLISVGKNLFRDKQIKVCLYGFSFCDPPMAVGYSEKAIFSSLTVLSLKYEDMTTCFLRLSLALTLWLVVSNIEELWTAYFWKMLPRPKIKNNDQWLHFDPRELGEEWTLTRYYWLTACLPQCARDAILAPHAWEGGPHEWDGDLIKEAWELTCSFCCVATQWEDTVYETMYVLTRHRSGDPLILDFLPSITLRNTFLSFISHPDVYCFLLEQLTQWLRPLISHSFSALFFSTGVCIVCPLWFLNFSLIHSFICKIVYL